MQWQGVSGFSRTRVKYVLGIYGFVNTCLSDIFLYSVWFKICLKAAFQYTWLSYNVRRHAIGHVRPVKIQISLRIAQSDQSLRCQHAETLHS